MDGGNTFRQARFLGTAVLGRGSAPTIQVANSFEGAEKVEWYRFRIRGRSSLPIKPRIGFVGSEFIPRMEVFRAVNGRPKRLMARLDTINSLKERALPEGIYFIKVTGSAPPPGTSGLPTFVAQVSLFG